MKYAIIENRAYKNPLPEARMKGGIFTLVVVIAIAIITEPQSGSPLLGILAVVGCVAAGNILAPISEKYNWLGEKRSGQF